jgi:chorismate mutase
MKEKSAEEKLKEFILEARTRGFDDVQIKEHLYKNNWPKSVIEKTFSKISDNPKFKYDNRINIYLDNELLKIIEKRAKKNFFTVPEQIQDILRRSCIMQKTQTTQEEKIDDLLVSIFSRKKTKKK